MNLLKPGYLTKYLAISIIFIAISNVIRTHYIIPKEKDYIYIICVITGVFVNVIVNLLLIPKLEAMGAVIGTILAEFSSMIVQLYIVRKELDLKEYFFQASKYLLSGIIMYIIIVSLKYIIINKYILIMTQLFLGIIIYTTINYRDIMSKERYILLKSILDKILAIIMLIVFLPLMVIIAIIIKLSSKGKIIFVHKRTGKDGKVLYLYKFRTMIENAEEMIENFTPEEKKEWNRKFKLKNDFRETKFGRLLRKSCLDELPQIINVLKGELALIGPRPITEEEIKKYNGQKDKLLKILPGITGYWQANCNENTTYEERINMELYYVDNVSFKLDFKIFFKTIGIILKKFVWRSN